MAAALGLWILPLNAAQDTGLALAPAPSLGAAQLAQLAAGLMVVLLVIFVLAFLLKRFGIATGAVSGKLRVVAGLSLGGRDRIVLIQAGEEQLLVGISPGRIQTLHVLKEPIPMEDPAANRKRFAEVLKKASAPSDSPA